MNPADTQQRACYVDGWLLGTTGTGSAVFARRLMAGLRRQQQDLPLRLLLPRRATCTIPLPAVSVVRLSAPRVGSPLLDAFLWQCSVAAFCRRHPRPRDSLLVPSPFCAPRAPARMAVVMHDLIHLRFPRYQGRKFVRRQLLRAGERRARQARVVFTQSACARRDLVDLGGIDPRRIRVIPAWLPPGYTPDDARPAAARIRARYGLPTGPYWLYVGGYDYRKNVEALIAAYARAAEAGAPPLVLAGTIPTDLAKPYCDVHGALRRAGLAAPRVVLPGFIADEDMPGLYGGAALFIYPSLYEGFGLPVLEAMGCGCPALAADNSSLREVVTDDAYRFPADKPETLAALLARAAARPLPLNPSFDPATFSEERAMRDYAACLQELMEGEGGA